MKVSVTGERIEAEPAQQYHLHNAAGVTPMTMLLTTTEAIAQ